MTRVMMISRKMRMRMMKTTNLNRIAKGKRMTNSYQRKPSTASKMIYSRRMRKKKKMQEVCHGHIRHLLQVLTHYTEKSAHELRQEAIAKQIAELETENVGAKDWTLMGEATSRKRPHNSLLEEDLEFEHTQRPVATTSASQIADLEALIKQRIMEVRRSIVMTHATVADRSFRRNGSTMCKRNVR
jgi:hypothetical protein